MHFFFDELCSSVSFFFSIFFFRLVPQLMFLFSWTNTTSCSQVLLCWIADGKRNRTGKKSTIGYSFTEFNWNQMSMMTMMMMMAATTTDGDSEPIKTFIVHSDLIRWFHLLNFVILFTFRLFVCCHISFDLILRFVPTMEGIFLLVFIYCHMSHLCVYACVMCILPCAKWYRRFDWTDKCMFRE